MAYFELCGEISERKEAVGVVKGFLVFAVGALDLAIMARGVGLDMLEFEAKLGGGFLE